MGLGDPVGAHLGATTVVVLGESGVRLKDSSGAVALELS